MISLQLNKGLTVVVIFIGRKSIWTNSNSIWIKIIDWFVLMRAAHLDEVELKVTTQEHSKDLIMPLYTLSLPLTEKDPYMLSLLLG